MNPDGKLQWANYTSQFGDGKRDPRAHTVEFLQGFFQAMDEGSIEVGGVPDESTKNEIFVGGLPQDIPEADVRVYFEGWGPILKLEHKQGKGFAFVTFEDEVTVQAILDNHASHEINGKWVDCKRAENRRGMSKGGGFGKKGGFKGGYNQGYGGGGGGGGGNKGYGGGGGGGNKGYGGGKGYGGKKGGAPQGGKGNGYGAFSGGQQKGRPGPYQGGGGMQQQQFYGGY